jgi:hypothetical protein
LQPIAGELRLAGPRLAGANRPIHSVITLEILDLDPFQRTLQAMKLRLG